MCGTKIRNLPIQYLKNVLLPILPKHLQWRTMQHTPTIKKYSGAGKNGLSARSSFRFLLKQQFPSYCEPHEQKDARESGNHVEHFTFKNSIENSIFDFYTY